eukprot:g5984.t1
MASLAKSSEDEAKDVGIRAKWWNAVSSLYNIVTFSFINPLLEKGAANELDENSAMDSNPLNETIEDLTTEFYRIYNRQEKDSNNSEKTHLMNAVMRTLIKQHAYLLLRHFMLTIGLLIGRLIGPLSLRWFLIWLSDYKEGNAE